jgi:hypothetical protein
MNVSQIVDGDPFEYSSVRAGLFEDVLNSGVSLISMLSTSGGPVDLGGFYWNSENTNFNFINITKLPFLLGTNCLQGSVADVKWGYRQSAMRQLMVYDNGGIIGSIAPTEGTVQRINGVLLNLAHDKIFEDNVVNVGQLHQVLKTEIIDNYPTHEFYANGLTLFADPSMLLSVYQHKSGTITSSTTWEGNIIVDNTVTVNTGTVLTIKPGTNLWFNSSASLVVNGTLLAEGTSTNKITIDRTGTTGLWGSIIFIGTGSSNSVIDNVELKNCTEILCLNDADVTIQNSLIKDCSQAVNIYNSAPKIINNVIDDPIQNGIFGEANGKRPLIQGNTFIRTSGRTHKAIHLGNYTRPFITNNDITGFDHGMYLGGGTYASFTDNYYSTPSINNRMRNCNKGLIVGWGGTVKAGIEVIYSFFEYNANSIYNNIYHDVYVYRNSSVYAEGNWWGAHLPALMFKPAHSSPLLIFYQTIHGLVFQNRLHKNQVVQKI